MRAPLLSSLIEVAGRVAFVACAGLVAGCSMDAADTTTHRPWSPPTPTTPRASVPPQTRASTPLSTCTAAPKFDLPLLVADARTLGDPILAAKSAPIDDEHRLVVVDTVGGAWWTLVDVRAGTSSTLQRFDRLNGTRSLVVLGDGRVAWEAPGAVRIFHRMGWSQPFDHGPLGTPWITALDATRVLVVTGVDAMIFDETKGWLHAPPPPHDPGEPFSASLTNDGFAMVLAHDGGLQELSIDTSARWTTSDTSSLASGSSTILDDGAVVGVLFERDTPDAPTMGAGRLWVTRRRAPNGWSTPELFPDVDGEPLRIDDRGAESFVLSRGGDRAEQIVTALRCNADGTCTTRVLDRSFDGTKWGDVAELGWPTTGPFNANIVGDPLRPVILANGAARIDLDDGWSHPIGVHDGQSVIGTTADGFWMTAPDASLHPAYLFADARRYVVTHAWLSDETGPWPEPVTVDSAGALILASRPLKGHSAARITTHGDVQSLEAPDDSYLVYWTDAKPAATPPTLTALAYAAHRNAGNAAFGAVAWNTLGEAKYETDAVDARVWESSWEGCSATILYGVSQFGTSPADRTLMMLTARGDEGSRRECDRW